MFPRQYVKHVLGPIRQESAGTGHGHCSQDVAPAGGFSAAGEVADEAELDLDRCTVRVAISTAETDGGRLIDDDPKSQAGRRTVAFPKEIAPELRWHLATFAEPGEGGLVFVGPMGGRLRRSNFRRIWTRARNTIGLPDLHFHDLRHTGNTMAAGQGASLRELMERMGHSTARAALIYQHATRERDEAIAAGMGKMLTQARQRARSSGGSGTQRARGRRRVS
jgi:integrase